MSISSSLNAGVMGLKANASKLSVISDNIANSATYGYKRSEADFHSMVIGSSSGSYSAGGVRTTTQKLVSDRGSLVGTSNSTDIAVRGRGMIPVTQESAVNTGNGNAPMLLQTTGSFRTDEQGYLKSAAGLILMGWPAADDGTIPNFPRDTPAGLEPIQLNVNEFVGEPTTKMEVIANLPATGTQAGAPGDVENLSIEYYNNVGTSETVGVSFTPTVPTGPTDPASNQWTMQITDGAQAGAVVGEYVITFDDSRTAGGTISSVTTVTGGAYDPSTGEFSVNVAGGPMEIAIGVPGSSQGLTQLSDAFSPVVINKNGAPVGNMISVDIDANGMVQAMYDNGAVRTVYQVPLIDMPNPNGLLALDSQTYQISNDSGAYFMWDAGDGPTGDLVNYAREESTTDVASELTDLIQTQRAYSSNAKVIQTVDEMLQETTNIKR
ncbi:flagellar hook protein FlgE [Meridianimarinicoccus aquatilis]|uniref:Flagellar hook protein FlgE n=1 Tax=Meridianimarinicoccus aquatilis TaxID=2552766 RepID=A0A4R6B1V9_9RHOB|nr:flagellar hook-basal body complex protein [Fluviibacterium aquatile]TDL89228.1 flagellar hook-basal body complex protein [Fluviibacterium aquatile]